MKADSPRIVFMGTPVFAVESLEMMLREECNVVAVVTAPDKPAGRGKKMHAPAVKEFAAGKGLPVLQPVNLKDPRFVEELRQLNPDLQVVVAFRMLPEVVWRIPPLGTFNLHASLLPDYRGAAPIHHVIINGESRTGVTTFLIDEQIDTGRILLQADTEIGEEESAGELHDRLMVMGASLVLKTVEKLADGELEPVPQEEWNRQGNVLNSAPKIEREDCRIRWEQPGKAIHNLVRGLSPNPGAFTRLGKEGEEGTLCKIYSTSFASAVHSLSPGTLLSDGKKSLMAATLDGYLHIHTLQVEGRRRMDIADFLAGTDLVTFPHRFS